RAASPTTSRRSTRRWSRSSAKGSTPASARRRRPQAEQSSAARSRWDARRLQLPARAELVSRVPTTRSRRAAVAGAPPHRHGRRPVRQSRLRRAGRAAARRRTARRLQGGVRPAARRVRAARGREGADRGAEGTGIRRRARIVLEHFLDLLDVRELVDGWTNADDVERTKPHPDVVHAALAKAGTKQGVFLGDSRWDIEAAANAGLETVC